MITQLCNLSPYRLYCLSADPVITKALPNAPKGSVFISCIVGDRPMYVCIF